MQETQQIFFDPEVKQLIDSFSYCFGVKITLYSPLVEEWLVGAFLKSSDYCTLLQKGLHYRPRCLAQDKLMCERCKRLGKLTVYRCHGGLNEAVMPIERDGMTIGYAMLGQFRTLEHAPAQLLGEWTSSGLEEKDFISAYMARPYFEEETLSRMLHLFTMLINFVSSSSYVKLWQPQLVEKVIQYLDEHMQEPSNLTVVARAVDRSESAVSHAIKQKFGVSFKQLATVRKIQRFESLLNKNPLLQINEASLLVGFPDQLYFSRVYRKFRNCTPSQYIKTLHSKELNGELLSFG
ncbi:DNA-binding domain-containing protein, AraC-type [Sphaerochaeta pleomorpha str. Grapes]|uniref:DNA-binding domain-containing protein, AraC-type n=1 Tax=Sphaerochaeta pleomorpha (strain ATCC BAA-1885 / DSM 22778 / Grapes) TaxID=158190 RepID=G8QVM7_SPHPG|nr:PocR ligand-binding domain-containing protein [Sphaerochaeta pleomorpha]AEV29319.1 DNA-binding domain-containing protein, AraC-type [Sphaerochaeta pleomorpha str. Grapes]